MFNLIMAGLLGVFAPATTGDPCDAVPVERVVAIFAEAGEPVQAGEPTGVRLNDVDGFCTYEFRDKMGAEVKVSVEIRRTDSDDFTVCNPWGQGEGFRTHPDIADGACSSNSAIVPLATLYFRRATLYGTATIIWDREGVTDVRMEILERFTRAFVASLELPPHPATDRCAALPIDRIAAMFAEAGEPVKAEGGSSFRKGGAEISCAYAFTDERGITATIVLEVKPLGTAPFRICKPESWSENKRKLDFADEACSVGVPNMQLAWVHFRRDNRVGEATMMWERQDVQEVRRAVLERFARAWVTSAGF